MGENRGTDAKTYRKKSTNSQHWHIRARDLKEWNVQALEDPEWSQAKVRPKNREESIEERHRPRSLGKEEDDDLEDDEETVDECPEDAGGLVRDGTVSIVIAPSDYSEVSVLAAVNETKGNALDVVAVPRVSI